MALGVINPDTQKKSSDQPLHNPL